MDLPDFGGLFDGLFGGGGSSLDGAGGGGSFLEIFDIFYWMSGGYGGGYKRRKNRRGDDPQPQPIFGCLTLIVIVPFFIWMLLFLSGGAGYGCWSTVATIKTESGRTIEANYIGSEDTWGWNNELIYSPKGEAGWKQMSGGDIDSLIIHQECRCAGDIDDGLFRFTIIRQTKN